jgi:DNA invertase Pin-like site-specific DNA recombinase
MLVEVSRARLPDIVGDARTSSLAQVAGLEAQERELRAAGCDKIFREQVSSVAERQQLEAALDYVREGDSFTVAKLDRLARSVGDLLAIVARLEAKGVSLRVLSMSGTQALDTGTSTGRLMLSVIGAVGQAEREANANGRGSRRRSVKADTRAVCRP